MANPLTGMMIRPIMQRRNAKKLTITSLTGIREEQFVTIGGIKQWVTIRGQDKSNPVLLILHGGPGSPYTPFNAWLGEWEKHFTVVQWDQRGGGKTFQKNGADDCGPLSLDQLARDGIELAEYARARLHQNKLMLVASSVGSYSGLLMAQRRPELFSAYVGTDQNSPGGWELSFELTKTAAKNAHDKKGMRTLQAIPESKVAWTYTQHQAMNKVAIKDTKGIPNMINDLMLPALLFASDYKMSDIRGMEKGMRYSAQQLFNEMKAFDFDKVGYNFALPFYILQGAQDIITPVNTAKTYMERIDAPRKGLMTISNAGHLAAFCNPQEFLQDLLLIHNG